MTPETSVRRIVVLNSKGGCGKTTVATNLASLYARRGFGTALFDCDVQASSMRWVHLRGESLPHIHDVAAGQPGPMNVTRTWKLRVPPGTQRVVVDSPAAMKTQELPEHVRTADVILVPVVPSPIDIFATADFIRDLLLIGKVRTPQTRIGIVANRIRSNTIAYRSLQRFISRLNIPVVAELRDTQLYLRATEQGIGVHELDDRRADPDRETWHGLFDWLEGVGSPKLTLVPAPKANPQPSTDWSRTQSGG